MCSHFLKWLAVAACCSALLSGCSRVQPAAAFENLEHLWVSIVTTQLAAVDAVDLTVLLERTEGCVNPAQPLE